MHWFEGFQECSLLNIILQHTSNPLARLRPQHWCDQGKTGVLSREVPASFCFACVLDHRLGWILIPGSPHTLVMTADGQRSFGSVLSTPWCSHGCCCQCAPCNPLPCGWELGKVPRFAIVNCAAGNTLVRVSAAHLWEFLSEVALLACFLNQVYQFILLVGKHGRCFWSSFPKCSKSSGSVFTQYMFLDLHFCHHQQEQSPGSCVVPS